MCFLSIISRLGEDAGKEKLWLPFIWELSESILLQTIQAAHTALVEVSSE